MEFAEFGVGPNLLGVKIWGTLQERRSGYFKYINWIR